MKSWFLSASASRPGKAVIPAADRFSGQRHGGRSMMTVTPRSPNRFLNARCDYSPTKNNGGPDPGVKKSAATLTSVDVDQLGPGNGLIARTPHYVSRSVTVSSRSVGKDQGATRQGRLSSRTMLRNLHGTTRDHGLGGAVPSKRQLDN